MTLHTLLAAAVLTALAAAQPARADASASGALDQFDYRLVDLTPSDGATPWISLTLDNASVEANLFNNPYYNQEGALSEYATHFGGASITNAEGTASAVAGPDADSASERMRINSGRSAGQTTWRFRLSANTRVVFSAYGSVDASPGGAGNFAYADAAIVGWVGDLVNGAALTFSNEMYTRNGEFDGVLEATGFSGASDTDGLVQIRSLAAVAPVPEPATCLLLLGGLGALSLLRPAAWRRRTARLRRAMARRWPCATDKRHQRK